MNLWLWCYVIWQVNAVVFTGIWLLQKKTKNAGIVDLAWTFGTGIAGMILVGQASGPAVRKWIVGGIVLAWTLRLGIYLGVRIFSEEEDGRYADMRKKWGDAFEKRIFLFFQLQAIWTLLFALPMYSAAMNDGPAWQWFDIAGILLFSVSLAGVTLADYQLFRFRSDESNRGRVCRVGLWKYSRHPNYFFEWLHWLAYVFVSFGSPWMIGTVAGALVMFWFLTKVTGIPITEKRVSSSRKQEFEIYQNEVNAFFPGPVRHSADTGNAAAGQLHSSNSEG